MKEIHVSVTATRTSADNEFKGTITFTSGKDEKLVIEYLDKSPTDEIYDLEFLDEHKKFELKGQPSKEMFEVLTNKEKFIIGLSFELLAQTIQNSKQMGLSHATTQILRSLEADASGQMEATFEVNEECHTSIFGMVTSQ